MKNTKKQGLLRFFRYYDKQAAEYVGVCIELGIIKCGPNPYNVEQDLIEAARGYVETIQEQSLPDNLLNQQPPQEYLDIYDLIIQAAVKRTMPWRSNIDFDEARTFLKNVPELCPAI